MADLNTYLHLGLALAIGLLIGLERGWQERAAAAGARVAGFRSFALLGLAGGGAGLLSQHYDGYILAATLIAVACGLAAGYVRDMAQTGNVSATNFIAGLLTVILGALATLGYPRLAASAAVVTALILSLREEMHGWVARLEQKELMASLRFLLISVVALPLLPNQGYGPYDALNPYVIWWMVVLISGISFAGYIAVKLWGIRRGLMLTAAIGALVSSTAITLAFAQEARAKPGRSRILAAGVILASTIMVLRAATLTALLAPSLVPLLAASFIPLALSGAAASYALWRGSENDHNPSYQPANPFELHIALFFGVGLGLIIFFARLLQDMFGDVGLYGVALVSGLIDVDAMTVSGSQLYMGGVAAHQAAAAIAMAALSNTAAKAAIGIAVGDKSFARMVGISFAAMALAGLAGLGFSFWRHMPL